MRSKKLVFLDQESHETVDNKRDSKRGKTGRIVTASILGILLLYRLIVYIIADEIVRSTYPDSATISLSTLAIVWVIMTAILGLGLYHHTQSQKRTSDGECISDAEINKNQAIFISSVLFLALLAIWCGSVIYTMFNTGDGFYSFRSDYMKNEKSIFTDYYFLDYIMIGLLSVIASSLVSISKSEFDLHVEACCIMNTGNPIQGPTTSEMECWYDPASDSSMTVCLLKQEKN